jgi:2-polyprenyl-6-hydroxyphenyl methylase/3-demethylubiquinone-9 3-methyltransferase
LNLLPRGTHEYQKLIKPSELERMCRAARLRVMELTGMHYNPLTRHYRLGRGVDVNYIAYARRADD